MKIHLTFPILLLALAKVTIVFSQQRWNDPYKAHQCEIKQEKYNYCGMDPKCEPSCEGPDPNPDFACSQQCFEGCYCDELYYGNGRGWIRESRPTGTQNKPRCVHRDQCPGYGGAPSGFPNFRQLNRFLEISHARPHSGRRVLFLDSHEPSEIDCDRKGEIFDECGIDPSCLPTCKDPVEKPCNKMCHVGCYCPKGFLRINPPSNMQCVPKDQCPATHMRHTESRRSNPRPMPPYAS